MTDKLTFSIRSVVLSLGLIFTLLLYGDHYSLHHDLAGSVLNGALAMELGPTFGNYSLYFPPMEWLWFSLASGAQAVSGVHAETVIVVMTVFAVFISVELAYLVKRQSVGATPAFYITTFATFIILPIIFKNVFGLREHMVILGLWPYLVSRIYPAQLSKGLRIAIGLWLGATLLFKYLYSVVVALVELANAISQRKISALFKTESVVATIVVAIYLFAWLGLNPEARASISLMSSSISANFVDPKVGLSAMGLRTGFALIVMCMLILFKVPRHIALVGCASILGAIIVAYVQQRWYTHHRFPIAMGFVFWWWAAYTYIPRLAHPIAAALIAMVFWGQYRQTERYQIRTDYLTQTLQKEVISLSGKRVAIMTQHPSPYNQVIAEQGGLRWTPMMNIAYMAAELREVDAASKEGTIVPAPRLAKPNPIHDRMLRLWEDHPPEIIILDRTHRWPLQNIDLDWMHVLSMDLRFLEVMKDYQPIISHVSDTLSFDVYKRSDTASKQ